MKNIMIFFQELAVLDRMANNNHPHPFLKKVMGIMLSPLSVMLSPPKPLDEIKGPKGQIPLDFFQSVGICNSAPSNVF